ncbi:hypothetical protein GU90_08775 [Saccharopolyspora rectivirgula]|uniref:Lipid/polyisoprenoid-binding YceI-like domain-containing protein n=2 Tax=Saccharopolyspora rectivirgula TaxID=28042 RepID=A0A073AYZ4_9PSEU|nr:hypothetical protein GU90_08775 [Saccharopolyspora rectivirgula]
MTNSAAGAVTATVCSGDGWPVPEAVLTVIDSTGTQAARVQGDASGTVVASQLEPGTYTAIITAVGFEPAARTALVQQGCAASLGTVELRRSGGADLPAPGLWKIDPVHSSIRATARHLGISSIHGRFTEFAGDVRIGAPIEDSSIAVAIQAASIDTANRMRDEHLRNEDFLNVAQYPEITFRSTRIRPRGGDRWDIEGELTLRGVTKPVLLDTKFGGVTEDPWGGVRASASATTQLRRDDFEITYNQALASGLAAIGTSLKVELDIQAVKSD